MRSSVFLRLARLCDASQAIFAAIGADIPVVSIRCFDALSVLLGLFLIQRSGISLVGAWFGPICLIWFLVLSALGLIQIVRDPGILASVSPTYAIGLIAAHPLLSFVLLGSVFLTVTGAEALYADMGHFGRSPISASWLLLVFPSLTLNYLGQGALVLAHPDAASNRRPNLVSETKISLLWRTWRLT